MDIVECGQGINRSFDERESQAVPQSNGFEECQRRWKRTMEIIQKYPEARRFMDLRKKWCAKHDKCESLKAKLTELQATERALWSELQEMKKTLPAEVREALG